MERNGGYLRNKGKFELADKPGSVLDSHSSEYTSPHISSNLPGYSAGRTIVPLFGLAPDGVYLATNCCQLCGALLPHPFTLTTCVAVFSLLHLPSAHAAQMLSGVLPYGARTFLPTLAQTGVARLPGQLDWGGYHV